MVRPGRDTQEIAVQPCEGENPIAVELYGGSRLLAWPPIVPACERAAEEGSRIWPAIDDFL